MKTKREKKREKLANMRNKALISRARVARLKVLISGRSSSSRQPLPYGHSARSVFTTNGESCLPLRVNHSLFSLSHATSLLLGQPRSSRMFSFRIWHIEDHLDITCLSAYYLDSRDHPDYCPFAFGTSEIISALLVYQPTTWTTEIILTVVLSPTPCPTSSFNFIFPDIIQIRGQEMASEGAMATVGDQNGVLLQVFGRILYSSIQPKRGNC
ncbi:hypothetical protein CRG98_008767 [Punica granatum]|uniref:Uncharacterized protein n=1 Tax=Punica granatum TaxID=22663 RepID=A0A2I0KSR4_PUNGR|nr:hypothetical protein CRG98_008767 [Punica granatum]